MTHTTSIEADFSHYPGREPPEVAGAKTRATVADERHHAKAVDKLEGALRKALAIVKVKVLMVADRKEALDKADHELTAAEQQAKDRPRFGRGRTVPTWMYVAAAVVFYIAEYWVDRGALLSLRLSTQVTLALALVAPMIGLLAAHQAGVYFNARNESISPSVELDPSEHVIGIGAVVLGVVHALVVGLIRGLEGGVLVGLFFCGLALTLFLGMTALAYRHADDDAARCAAAKRRRWWARRRYDDAEGQAEKRAAAARSLAQKRRDLASKRIARWDAAVASGLHSAEQRLDGVTFYVAPEPAWILEERSIAAGELPDHLRPLDLGNWVSFPRRVESARLELAEGGEGSAT